MIALRIAIDIERRARLSRNHTATHLVLMGAESVRPQSMQRVVGCAIGPDGARLDVRIEASFSAEELEQISRLANDYVRQDLPISLYQHPNEPEAWYWGCGDCEMPCGGTHLMSTGTVGTISLRRRSNPGRATAARTSTHPSAEPARSGFSISGLAEAWPSTR